MSGIARVERWLMRFKADANTGNVFAIFMASVGALNASRYGTG
jgi:hypothetical protein